MRALTYHTHWLVCLPLVLFSLNCAQGQVASSGPITNIRVELDSERVKVLYDAVGITSRDSVYLLVESQSRGLLNVVTVTGDVGLAVVPGKNKTIYWDYRLDGLRIDDGIRANIRVKRPYQRLVLGGGPTYALLSVVAPGIGNIFVQPNHKVGLRPLITGAYAGLLIYGLVQNARSGRAYDQYLILLNDSDYAEANRLNHQYLVATWTAVALLLTDVTYTFLKGRKNEQQKQLTKTGVVMAYAGTIPSLGFQFHF
jgi:hypothetical protein